MKARLSSPILAILLLCLATGCGLVYDPASSISVRAGEEEATGASFWRVELVTEKGSVIYDSVEADTLSEAFEFSPVPEGSYTVRGYGYRNSSDRTVLASGSAQTAATAGERSDVEVILSKTASSEYTGTLAVKASWNEAHAVDEITVSDSAGAIIFTTDITEGSQSAEFSFETACGVNLQYTITYWQNGEEIGSESFTASIWSGDTTTVETENVFHIQEKASLSGFAISYGPLPDSLAFSFDTPSSDYGHVELRYSDGLAWYSRTITKETIDVDSQDEPTPRRSRGSRPLPSTTSRRG